MKTKPITYAELPPGKDADALARQRAECLYTYLTKPLIDGLSEIFRGKNVLEVYAGRGHLSALLNEKGISIKSTSLRMDHDGSRDLGHVYEVEDMDAVSALEKYRDWADIVLVCWPTTNNGMFNLIKQMKVETPIVFIGEITDYSTSPPFLGSCATDSFFHNVIENPEMSAAIDYQCFDCTKIKVFHRKHTIERIQEYRAGYAP